MLQDIELTYRDQTFTVKEKQFISLIMSVELTKIPNDVYLGDDQAEADRIRNTPYRSHIAEQMMTMVSYGYYNALRFAGLEGVSHLDVHLWINEDVDIAAEVMHKCYMILFDLIIMPNNLKKQSSTKKKTVAKTKTEA